MAQSIEPNIADLANGWLKAYKLPYKLEQEPVNTEIDKALADYYRTYARLVIKDVVLYADSKIAATKSVVNEKASDSK